MNSIKITIKYHLLQSKLIHRWLKWIDILFFILFILLNHSSLKRRYYSTLLSSYLFFYLYINNNKGINEHPLYNNQYPHIPHLSATPLLLHLPTCFPLLIKKIYKSMNKGWISIDRRTKLTLILTIPCSKSKSSAKDLFLLIL